MAIAEKSPIARGLWVLVSVGMILVALGLVISVGILASAPLIDLSGAQMDLPVSVQIDSHALHVAAPSLGIEAAQLRKVHGSLVFPPGLFEICHSSLWFPRI